MTEKSEYTASISTKGLAQVGVDEDRARKLYSRRGREVVGIIRLMVDETTDKRDHTHRVGMSINRLELVFDQTDMENHLRELEQTLYSVRQQEDGQMAIDQSLVGTERTVADVLSSGSKHRPHPFLPDDVAKDTPICDVCGGIEASAVHSTQELISDAQDDDDDGDGDGDEPDPYSFVHVKGGSGPGIETPCGLRATIGKSLQRHEDDDQITCPKCVQFLQGDGLDVDPPVDDPEPWEYEEPEGDHNTAPAIADPFQPAGA